jgi:hypothetical protein
MGVLTPALREELETYFTAARGPAAAGIDIVAQSYEPKGSGYDPHTDTRLARLVLGRGAAVPSDVARVGRVIADLAPQTVAVLCSAVFDDKAGRTGYPSVAAGLPEALRVGRVVAERLLVEQAMQDEYDMRLRWGETGILLAMHVLEAAKRTRRPHTYEIAHAARAAVEAGEVDLEERATAVVVEAVALYVRTRDLYAAGRRADKARRAAERAALLDELLGKKRRRAAERFEAKLRRAS